MPPKRRKLELKTLRCKTFSELYFTTFEDYIVPELANCEQIDAENYQYISIDELKLNPRSAENFFLLSQTTFTFATGYKDIENDSVYNYFLSTSNGDLFILQINKHIDESCYKYNKDNPKESLFYYSPLCTKSNQEESAEYQSKWSYQFASWLYETQKKRHFRNTLTVDVEIAYGQETTQLVVNFYLSKKIIYDNYHLFMENFPKPNKIVTESMCFLRGIPPTVTKCEDGLSQPAISVDQFYLRACDKQVENSVFDAVILPPIDTLIPTLRTYQESAVKWMIHREKLNNSPKNYTQNVFVEKTFTGYKEKLYYNRNFGYFITQNVYTEFNKILKPSLGGILADEMGLGKTVETLALILHNKKETIQQNFSFFNREDLFSLTDHPRWGDLQCFCGVESIQLKEKRKTSVIIETCLEKKYLISDEYIKCLLCGNYQHIECSGYQLDEDDFPYLCGRCWSKVDLIDSGCTLIVCPRSILHQWEDEIKKHLRNVRTCVYNGIKNNSENVFAANLARYDIVLTTYDVLRSELNFSKTFELNQLRNSRRYYRAVSPLLAINWWRLCFDEAQMVESTYSMVAQMAESLSATYRWAITGTPIQRSVDDLYGLLYFINEEPYCRRSVWDTELYSAFQEGNPEPLINAVVSCFWRTPKSAVIDELNILAPIYTEKRLELSQIERDFYNSRARQFYLKIEARFARESPNTMLANVNRESSRLAVLSMATTLRQTCCHPSWALNNVLRRKNRRKPKQQQEGDGVAVNPASRRRFVSLNDVLDNMIEGMKVEAEGAHREVISSLNGLAAVQLYWGRFTEAIACYKAGLISISDHAEHIRTDKTQKYHIYYNLAQIVETFFGVKQVTSSDSEEPLAAFNGEQPFTATPEASTEDHRARQFIQTHCDRLLRSQAKEVYNQYISNEYVACMGAEKYRLELVKKCDDIKADFQYKGKWFVAALNALEPYVEIEEFVEILNRNVQKEHENFLKGETSLLEIQYKLDSTMESIKEARDNMVSSFEPLLQIVLAIRDGDDFVRCHIRKVLRADKCMLCAVEEEVKTYEKLLFSLQIKKKIHRKKRVFVSDNNEENDGNNNEEDENLDLVMDVATQDELNERMRRRDEMNWNECNTLVALRRVANLYKARSKQFEKSEVEAMVQEIDSFIEFIDETKKEFKAHRRFWTHLFDYVLRLDELNQAQGRMTFPDCTEEMIRFQCNDFFATRQLGESKRESLLVRYRYLKNLKESMKNRDAVESRVCSICWGELSRYYVLTCGHFFCDTCLLGQIRHGTPYNVPEGQVRCSVCRQLSNRDDLCCIDSVAEAYGQCQVNGSWSTKIVNIVRTVKHILQTAGDKILLFSTWPALLYLVNQSLAENDIKSLLVEASRGSNFARNIQTFKHSEDVNVLLLPTNFACNGLNLTEANHVIFINSSLNRADELQAIGRVYRIGQRKQTYVYKFIIKSSIEETIEDTISKVFTNQNGGAAPVANSEFNDMTVNEFMRLFSC